MIIIFFVFFLFINYFECLNWKIIKNKKYNMKGIYQIYNLLKKDYLGIDNNDNALFCNINLCFCLYKIESNSNNLNLFFKQIFFNAFLQLIFFFFREKFLPSNLIKIIN